MPQESLDDILKEISDFIEVAVANAGKPIKNPITPEIEASLDKLENALHAFQEKMAKEVISSGMNPKDLQASAFTMPEGLTKKQQETWEKAAKLRWDLEGMRYVLNDVIKKSMEPHVLQKSPTGKKRAVTKRRSQFKKMGGDKWKKM